MRAGRAGLVALATIALTMVWTVAPTGAEVSDTELLGFTGQPIVIVVPADVCGYNVDLAGANGGDTPKADGSGMSGRGGRGGRIAGRIGVLPGQTVRVDLGGVGQDGDKGGAGGFGVGGKGGTGGTQTGSTGIASTGGAGGGGMSALRVNNQFALVAGGGGGAGGPEPTTTNGGHGGDGGMPSDPNEVNGQPGSDSSPVGGKPGGGGSWPFNGDAPGLGGARSTSNTGATSGSTGTAADGGSGGNANTVGTVVNQVTVSAGGGGGGGAGWWGGGGGGGGAGGGGDNHDIAQQSGGGGGGGAPYIGPKVENFHRGDAVQDANGNGGAIVTEIKKGSTTQDCPPPFVSGLGSGTPDHGDSVAAPVGTPPNFTG